MAFVTGPDGRDYTLDDAELPKALAQGFRVRQPTADEQARAIAADSPLQAGVESAARTFLPVVGEDLLTAFEQGQTGQTEEQVLESQRRRKQENPIATAIGSGAGFIAGPGKLLKPITAPMRAAGLLGTATAGMAEGALMGVDEAINESMLDNQPLTSERLAANVLPSMLMGGAVDFGMGALAKGTSAILKKAAGSSLSDFLSSKADDLSIGMIDRAAWAKKYGVFEDDIAKIAREEGVLSMGTQLDEASVAASKAATERVGQQMADELAGAQKFRPPDQDKIFETVMEKLRARGLERDPLAQNAIKEVQETLDFMKNQGSTYQEYWNLQSRWRTAADVGQTAKADVLDVARKELRDTIMDAVQGGAGSVNRLRELNRRYAALNAFEDGLADATRRYEASHGPGLIGTVAAAGAFSGGGAIPAAGTLVANRMLRKRGGFLVGEALKKLSDSDMIGRVSKSFEQVMAKRLAVPELLGPFRATLEAAAAQGSDALLQTHMQLSTSRVGPEYLATLGMEPPSPDRAAAVSGRLAALESMKRAADENEVLMASAADGLFGAAPGRKGGVSSTMSRKEYEKALEGIRATLRDPESAYAKIPAEFQSAAPGLMGMTALTALNAARFLEQRAPKNPYEGMPPSVAPRWAPSAEELDRFSRLKEAVESPARVLKNMSAGYMSPDQIEAIKAVYPAMYADLQQKIGERLAVYPKALSYKQKLALSAVIGPGALGMSPQQVQVLQQAQALASGAGNGQGQPVKRPDGRQDVNEDQMTTESEKLEAR